MGLFSKKTCSICGGEIGMLSNKKLADGDMCKECNGKLSPWFDDRKKSTIEDIKKQMAAREENRKALYFFDTTDAYGEFGCILIDRKHQQFVALPTTSDTFFGNSKVIVSIEQIEDKNPDIVKFSQVSSVEVKTKVSQNEIMKTVNGEKVSYDPKHYNYACNFEVHILVDHPYIREMIVPINSAAVIIPCDEPRRITTYAEEIRASLTGLKTEGYGIENIADYREVSSLQDIIFGRMKQVPDYSFGFKVDQDKNWREIKKYQYYLMICNNIKECLESKWEDGTTENNDFPEMPTGGAKGVDDFVKELQQKQMEAMKIAQEKGLVPWQCPYCDSYNRYQDPVCQKCGATKPS